MDCNTTLCLACSSSLPPRSSSHPWELFTTNCCNRPICPKCISSNPRLARYDPCLACLAGVQVLRANSSQKGTTGRSHGTSNSILDKGGMNVDGSVREQDLFVLGDDDEDAVELGDYEGGEGDDDGSSQGAVSTLPPAPPPEPAIDLEGTHTTQLESGPNVEEAASTAGTQSPVPPKYYIKRSDTLLGIALRFKIDSYELCRLNNLPKSTVNTTPHLLHTRTYLTLPLSVSNSSIGSGSFSVGPSPSRVVERAEKRFQNVTKEVDWRVAKAYVALAEDDNGDDSSKKESLDMKTKTIFNQERVTIEVQAIDRYLDDAEWEENERKQGRGVSIQRFPHGGFGGKGSTSTSFRTEGFKWPWSS